MLTIIDINTNYEGKIVCIDLNQRDFEKQIFLPTCTNL